MVLKKLFSEYHNLVVMITNFVKRVTRMQK